MTPPGRRDDPPGSRVWNAIPAAATVRGMDAPRNPPAATVPAPVGWVRSVSELRLPDRADRRLTDLMDRNTNGELSPDEREELAALAEVSESLSLVRANAFGLLGAAPR